MTSIPAEELISEDIDPGEETGYDDYYPREETPRETPGESRFRGIVADANLADFVKIPKTQVAREYEKRTAAALNSVFKGLAGNPSTVIDAATILAYGDGLSASAGELAQQDEKARGIIDFITSPSNPWVAFAMIAIPFGAQLLRNHETDIDNMKPVKRVVGVKIPFTKKAISIPLRFRLRLPRKLRAHTVQPVAMLDVFNHPDVKKALKRRGISVAAPADR